MENRQKNRRRFDTGRADGVPGPGESIKLIIEGITHSAEGVGRCRDFTIFVPGALPGDTVRVEVISRKKNYARALLRDVLEASPDRVPPVCPHFEDCGGCQLMHAAYGAQLRYKREQVEEALKRIGGLDNIDVRPTLGMEVPKGYRNKAHFPVGLSAGRPVVGCYRPHSHEIVDIDSCFIQHDEINRVLAAAKSVLEERKTSIYDEKLHRGLLRSTLVRHSFNSGETMIVFVINGRELPGGISIASRLMQELPGLVSVQVNENCRQGNTLLGPVTRTLAGRKCIIENIGGLNFKISARSFFQVNPAQAARLYAAALAGSALQGEETVFDLFSGVGTIALCAAGRAGIVRGFEVVPEAVRDAAENARLNGIDNARFTCGPVEETFPLAIAGGETPQVCIVDPPRAGCSAKVLEAIASAYPPRLIYISCNPATLARDLRYLYKRGYTAGEVQPVDMFPHTSHVECMVSLEKRE